MKNTLRLLSAAALLTMGAATAMAASTTTDSSTYSTPGTAGMSAQSSGNQRPGVLGPTGSRQPDATNPVRSNPSGGGGMDNGGGANGSGGTGGSGGSGTGR